MADKASRTFFRLGDLQVPANDLGVCVREDFLRLGMLVFLRPNVKLILPDAKFVTRCAVSAAVAPATRGRAYAYDPPAATSHCPAALLVAIAGCTGDSRSSGGAILPLPRTASG